MPRSKRLRTALRTPLTLLGLMLVFEPKEHGLMDRPPRDPASPLLTGRLVIRTLLVGWIIVGGSLWLFDDQITRSGETVAEARTTVINTIVMVETAYLFSCRSLGHSLFHAGLFTNKFALAGAAAMILLQGFFTYSPVMNRLFHSVPLEADTWLGIAGVAVLSFIVVEIEKQIRFPRPMG